jgi:hypothetical protein
MSRKWQSTGYYDPKPLPFPALPVHVRGEVKAALQGHASSLQCALPTMGHYSSRMLGAGGLLVKDL